MFMPLNVGTLSLSWYISYNVLVLNVTTGDSNNSCYEMKYCELNIPLLIPILTNLQYISYPPIEPLL